ncbi:MAG: FkbM family methyltransferase [Alphaproteobacteria bacterium]
MIKRAFKTYQSILAGEGIGRVPFVAATVRGLAAVTGMAALGRWVLMRRPVDMGGFQLYLDPRSTSAPLLGKGFNKKEAAYARTCLQPGDMAVDVGANIGFFAALFGTLVGPDGKVFAFEPVPANIAILKRNIGLNNLDNVVIEPSACGETNAVAAMQVEGNLSTARMETRGENTDGGSSGIAVVTIDSVLAGDPRPVRFMKIDIEGFELFALRGADETLARSPDIELLVEYSESAFAQFGYSGADLIAHLAEHGFHAIDLRRGEPFTPRDGTVNVLFKRG